MMGTLTADVLEIPNRTMPRDVHLGGFTYFVHYRISTDDWIHVARIERPDELWSYTEVTQGHEPSAGFSQRALIAIRRIWETHA